MTNSNSHRFSITGRIKSVGHALAGLLDMLKGQHNAWIHAVATILVLGVGIVFDVTRIEWALLVIAIVLVWVAEALNTAIEWLCDVASPDFHPLVKKSKDVAAAAVLMCAAGAVVIGLLVFWPYLKI